MAAAIGNGRAADQRRAQGTERRCLGVRRGQRSDRGRARGRRSRPGVPTWPGISTSCSDLGRSSARSCTATTGSRWTTTPPGRSRSLRPPGGEVDHLLSRYGAAAAELEISRRLLAEASRGREVFPVSRRVEEMLRLAADEAAAMTEAGAAGGRPASSPRRAPRPTPGCARPTRSRRWPSPRPTSSWSRPAGSGRTPRPTGNGRARRPRRSCGRPSANASGWTRRPPRSAGAADRAATAQLLAVQEKVDALGRQRDEARQSLRGLTDRIGQALQAVVGTLPDGTAPPDQRGDPAACGWSTTSWPIRPPSAPGEGQCGRGPA